MVRYASFFGASIGAIVCVLMAGCAAGNNATCTTSLVLSVSPTSATADHTAAAPGNQVKFQGVAGYVASGTGSGCAIPEIVFLEYAAWQNPDPLNISISSANDSTNGTAVCTGTTAGAVTLTGTFAPVTVNGPAGSGSSTAVKTVTLTCR